ncbi:MAG: hypothetical protein ABFC21_07065 [Rectinema sp.]
MKIVIDSVLNHGYNYNHVRKDAAMSYRVNLVKWYLDGRFKAVPSINPAEFELQV